MIPLPIDPYLPQINTLLKQRRAVVVVAEPGAGKTTRVPPAILEAGLLSKEHPNLVMLQPRRIAARAAAQRIADERGWVLGREVGYQIRFERKMMAATRLRVLTEGILTRRLVEDPLLDGIGAVVLDEFHERSLHTDMAIALLREVQQARPELMLIVMSATLAAEPVARFLGDCPIVRVEGRTYPVQIEHAATPAHLTRHTLPERIAETLEEVLVSDAAGDVLVFLPGADEIRRAQRAIEGLAARHDLLVLPLHGSLSGDQQLLALQPSPLRKVILATNIAETSLTIDGVRTVIDTGLHRLPMYDPRRGMDRLALERISKASATQRAGRAGRTAPGYCIRLWSAKQHAALAEFDEPEIRRVDLTGTVLALHAWGQSDPRRFAWFEAPDERTIAAAARLLEALGAIERGQITALGRRILALPVHPRLARLLLAANDAGQLEEGAAMAALLGEKDIVRDVEAQAAPRHLRAPATQGASDLLLRLQLLADVERTRFSPDWRDRGIDLAAARQVARTRDELMRIARRITRAPAAGSPRRHDADETLLRALLVAYPDRVARRRQSDPSAAIMVGGGGVRLDPTSIVRKHEFFLALDARHDERNAANEAIVRIASAIEPQWLEELFPQQIQQMRAAEFDAQRQRVVGVQRVMYRDLVVRESRDAVPDVQQAAEVLAEALRPRLDELIAQDESLRQYLARIAFLRHAMPELHWPANERQWIDQTLSDACAGHRSVDQAMRALSPLVRDRLPYELRRTLEIEAPEAIEVPSGNRIRLEYTQSGSVLAAPVLAVRLQEMFGLADTPRVAGGRVPVVLHLLGPNFRPVQVTTDLRSFWANTYPQVRKDLRARYPRHAWPEDPMTATPQAKGGRRRT